MSATQEQKLWMYKTMVLIRGYEEQLGAAYFEGKLPPAIQSGLAFDLGAGPVPGEMHLSAGQEAAAAGVCAHLKKGDSVWGTHRAHHFAIAHGVNLNRMTAEIFGKVDGLGRGKGGHMHLFDTEAKFACSGIVGAGIPQATGAALAAKRLGKDWVAVAEFGEGASNQGAFHEALNMASLWKLPVVFVCQDNNYGISVSKARSTSVASIADRASGYNMPGIKVEENDAQAIFAAAGEAVERARNGGGPTLIEAKVFRYCGHFEGDPQGYRPPKELEELRALDPIPRLAEQLKQDGLANDDQLAEIKEQAQAKITEALTFARESEYPSTDEAFQHVFAE